MQGGVQLPGNLGGSHPEHIFEGVQTLTRCEDVVLESAECELPGPAVLLFPQGQSECGGHPQMIGVITVLIARRHLIDSLAQQLEQGMIRISIY